MGTAKISPQSLLTRHCHSSIVLCVSPKEARPILDEVIPGVNLAAHLWEYHLAKNLVSYVYSKGDQIIFEWLLQVGEFFSF